MPKLPDPPPCPNQAAHTIHPTSYIAQGEWAEQMLLTHTQKRCPACGLLAIWEPKPGVTDLARPALYDGGCAGCDAWYEAGAKIRTDGTGGWLTEGCPEVAHV